MFFRAHRLRRQADRREARQQGLLRDMRAAIGEGRFGDAVDIGEGLLDESPTAASYEALLSPIDRSGGGATHA
jgi:hypothetical protein